MTSAAPCHVSASYTLVGPNQGAQRRLSLGVGRVNGTASETARDYNHIGVRTGRKPYLEAVLVVLVGVPWTLSRGLSSCGPFKDPRPRSRGDAGGPEPPPNAAAPPSMEPRRRSRGDSSIR